MAGGRPVGTVKTLTDEEKRQVEKLAPFLTKEQMAGYFGMSEPTLSRIFDDEPELFLAYKKGKSKAISMVGNSLLMQARDGNMTAAIFYLKTQAGWKEDKAEPITEEKSPMRVIVDHTIKIEDCDTVEIHRPNVDGNSNPTN